MGTSVNSNKFEIKWLFWFHYWQNQWWEQVIRRWFRWRMRRMKSSISISVIIMKRDEIGSWIQKISNFNESIIKIQSFPSFKFQWRRLTHGPPSRPAREPHLRACLSFTSQELPIASTFHHNAMRFKASIQNISTFTSKAVVSIPAVSCWSVSRAYSVAQFPRPSCVGEA